MSIAKDIIQEVREDAPKLLLEDSNSPFSSKNLNNMIKNIDIWAEKCNTLFKAKKKNQNAFENYWGGEGPEAKDKVSAGYFKEAENQQEVLRLFKEGFHLATTIRKVLTGEKNRLRILFEGEDKSLSQIEIDESELFKNNSSIGELLQITSSGNLNKINARFGLTLNQENAKKLQKLANNNNNKIESIQLDSKSQEVFNYIYEKNLQRKLLKEKLLQRKSKNNLNEKENKKLEVASQYLNQGRLLEAFYEVMETNIVNEIAGPLTRGQKAMLTNYVQHRFQGDTVWGVQQVGDMMTFNSDGSINQVQLKAFVEGTTGANFGGLPSVITQLNRVKQLLLELDKTRNSKEMAEKIKNVFYYQGGEKSETAIRSYIEEVIEKETEKAVDTITKKLT